MADQPSRSAGELARDVFHRLFTDRDVAAVERYWSERTVDHFLALGESIRGTQALAAFFRELLAAVPDLRMEVERVVDEGREAVVQWTMAGTLNGSPFRGIEPTGRPVRLRGVDVIRFDDEGRIEENTIYFDGAEFARQLGMLPRQKSPADRAMLGIFNAVVRVRRHLPGANGRSRRAASEGSGSAR
jgi:steroid delta-isomerase-like uncharacterized protein